MATFDFCLRDPITRFRARDIREYIISFVYTIIDTLDNFHFVDNKAFSCNPLLTNFDQFRTTEHVLLDTAPSPLKDLPIYPTDIHNRNFLIEPPIQSSCSPSTFPFLSTIMISESKQQHLPHHHLTHVTRSSRTSTNTQPRLEEQLKTHDHRGVDHGKDSELAYHSPFGD